MGDNCPSVNWMVGWKLWIENINDDYSYEYVKMEDSPTHGGCSAPAVHSPFLLTCYHRRLNGRAVKVRVPH